MEQKLELHGQGWDQDGQKCIGRESNPGLAESREMISLMATANFTTKPPMLDVEASACLFNMLQGD